MDARTVPGATLRAQSHNIVSVNLRVISLQPRHSPIIYRHPGGICYAEHAQRYFFCMLKRRMGVSTQQTEVFPVQLVNLLFGERLHNKWCIHFKIYILRAGCFFQAFPPCEHSAKCTSGIASIALGFFEELCEGLWGHFQATTIKQYAISESIE